MIMKLSLTVGCNPRSSSRLAETLGLKLQIKKGRRTGNTVVWIATIPEVYTEDFKRLGWVSASSIYAYYDPAMDSFQRNDGKPFLKGGLPSLGKKKL